MLGPSERAGRGDGEQRGVATQQRFGRQSGVAFVEPAEPGCVEKLDPVFAQQRPVDDEAHVCFRPVRRSS